MFQRVHEREDLLGHAVATCRGLVKVFGNHELVDNASVVYSHMPANNNSYIITLDKDDPLSKMISKSKSFAVHFFTKEHWSTLQNAKGVNGIYTDMFSHFFEKKESEKIDAPRIGQAKHFIECELSREFESGKNMVFLGKVLHHNF
jgi:flavin reductase (DIM6/NTAB) family NADH-FMN oxidoreductase RutF